MQVVAVSTPQKDAGWRWRIVDNAGEVVEESLESFPTIAIQRPAIALKMICYFVRVGLGPTHLTSFHNIPT
jgi:hypothetical protein